MERKQKIHGLISKMADEVLAFVREEESSFKNGWVPSAHIKKSLALNFVCVPKNNKQYGEKGWLLAILARLLEDKGKIEYQKIGNRAFYRSK